MAAVRRSLEECWRVCGVEAVATRACIARSGSPKMLRRRRRRCQRQAGGTSAELRSPRVRLCLSLHTLVLRQGVEVGRPVAHTRRGLCQDGVMGPLPPGARACLPRLRRSTPVNRPLSGQPSAGSSAARPAVSRKRMGPRMASMSGTGWPFCVISSTPRRTSARPAARVSSISCRQRAGKARRGASLGQQLAPGLRERRMSKMAASSAACSSCWPPSEVPSSPVACAWLGGWAAVAKAAGGLLSC